MSWITAIDFETDYDNKYSITTKGSYGYIHDPRFNAYLVSVARRWQDDNTHRWVGPVERWVGHPSELPWEDLCTEDALWLSHNKSFDGEVHKRLRDLKRIPDVVPPRWYCTADMSCYFGLPRALSGVISYLFNVTLDKDVRTRMSGRTIDMLTPGEKESLLNYALADAEWLLALWGKLGHHWPEHERLASCKTSEMANKGIPVNVDMLEDSIRSLRQRQFEIAQKIPWDWSDSDTPLQPTKLAIQCRQDGIEPPASRAKDSPVLAAWLAEHGERFPYVKAMGEWNSCNALVKKLETMLERSWKPDPEQAHGWLPHGLLYCHTHTGRDGAAGGFNSLNMHKEAVFDINLRHHIQPPPGYVFLSGDYSQIEPRVLAYLCEDEDLLAELRKPDADIYVAFGLKVLNHQGEWTKKDRHMWKAAVLGLGYGCGPPKFVNMAYSLTGGQLEITLAESTKMVNQYRAKNQKVTGKKDGFWAKMEKAVRGAVKEGFIEFVLPSGRRQYYRDIKVIGGLSAMVTDKFGFQRKRLWGGTLTENIVQAVARDIFMDGYLRLEAHGLPVVLRVYDEFLVMVPEEGAEENRQLMERLMVQAPAWAPDLPLASEVKIISRYEK